MADIAQLGIQINSKGAKAATGDLNQLSGAAMKAEVATDRLEVSADGASAATQRLGKSASGAAGQVQQLAAKAANANNRMGGSFAGLGAQFQDIGVTAAMGMNPMIIGLQQGTQIAGQFAFALQNGGSAVGLLRTAFLSLITPLSLMSIGLTVVIAALIQMVNWPHAAASALQFLANNLDSIVAYAGAAAAALALMYAPTIIGGIASATIATYGLATAAISAAGSFIAAWAAAASPFTLIVAGLAVVVGAIWIFRDEIAQAIGIDIPAEAYNAGNMIVGAFVGAYDAVISVWQNIPAAMADLLISATNGVIGAIESMLNKAIGLINKFISSVGSAVSSLPGMEGFGGFNTIPTISIERTANIFTGAASKMGSDIGAAFSNALSKDYIGGATQLATGFISDAKDRLTGLAKTLRTMGDDDKNKKSGGKSAGQKAAEAYQSIVDGANRTIASNQAAMAAIGQTAEQALKLKYSQDLLNQAQQKGLTLTAAQKAELEGLAGEMARTETAVSKAKDTFEFAKSTVNGFFSDLRSGLKNGEGFWKSFGNAAMNVLDKIVDKIQNNLVDALFSAGSAGSGGGVGSGITGILGSILGGFGFANGGYTGNMGTGTVAGVVHGQEYVMPASATKRIGVGNLEAMARGGSPAMAPRPANNNSRVAVDNQVTVSVDDEGAIQAYVNSQVSQSEARTNKTMADSRKGEPKRIASANQQRQLRRPIT